MAARSRAIAPNGRKIAVGPELQFYRYRDAWRDAKGKLWAPNMLAPITAPQLKLDQRNWLIGTVTYIRDENGQHAQLGLGPPEAFTIEPTSPNVFVTQQDVNNANPTKPNAPVTTTPTKFEPSTATASI